MWCFELACHVVIVVAATVVFVVIVVVIVRFDLSSNFVVDAKKSCIVSAKAHS
jgi:hypothetical protein